MDELDPRGKSNAGLFGCLGVVIAVIALIVGVIYYKLFYFGNLTDNLPPKPAVKAPDNDGCKYLEGSRIIVVEGVPEYHEGKLYDKLINGRKTDTVMLGQGWYIGTQMLPSADRSDPELSKNRQLTLIDTVGHHAWATAGDLLCTRRPSSLVDTLTGKVVYTYSEAAWSSLERWP